MNKPDPYEHRSGQSRRREETSSSGWFHGFHAPGRTPRPLPDGRRGVAIRLRARCSHPLSSAIAMVLGVAAVAEDAYYTFAVSGGAWTPRNMSWGVAMLCLLAAAAAWNVVRPQYGGYAVVLATAVMTMTVAPVPLTAFLLAFAVIGSLSFLDPVSGCAAGVTFASLMIVYGSLEPDGIMGRGGAATFAGCVATASAIGCVVHAVVRRNAAKRRRLALERDLRIARELHDHTTNDLSDIVILVNQHLADADSGGDATGGDPGDTDLRAVRDLALDALRHTRRTIAMLDGRSATAAADRSGGPARAPADVPTDHTVAGRAPNGDLVDGIERHRLRLRRLGHAGEVIVIGDRQAIPAPAAAFIAGLLRELFGNVAKYADPTREYTMIVAFSPDGCAIDLSDYPRADRRDDVGSDADSGTDRDSGGAAGSPGGLRSGLARYRRLIERAGGVMTVTDGDRWTLHARIPSDIA